MIFTAKFGSAFASVILSIKVGVSMVSKALIPQISGAFRRLSLHSDAPPYFTQEILSHHYKYELMTRKLKSDLVSEIRVLKVRRLKCQTGIENRRSFSVAIVVGNKNGSLGYALGKDRSPMDAMLKATKAAERSMDHYELYMGRTIFHDDYVVYKDTKIAVRPMPPESGVRAHWAIQEICRCIGIQDLSAKVYGSRTAINVANCFLLALQRQKTPEQVARDSGMRVIDVIKVFQTGSKFVEPSFMKSVAKRDAMRAMRNQAPPRTTEEQPKQIHSCTK